MQSFSIVVCTHNPDKEIFARLLKALLLFSSSGIRYEVILVDNNSSPSLEDRDDVKDFLAQTVTAMLVLEKEPGLTAARMAGIARSQYDWLIFFDDDNEPAENYLNIATGIITEHPRVGAWGPGTVIVEYPAEHEKKYDAVKDIFQERHESHYRLSDEKWWQDCYPAGTGLIIRKDVAVDYAEKVRTGIYRLTDRKGKSLSSGGDLQMVLTAIKKGFFAGVHPGLRMNHIIGDNRLSPAYLNRLAFGTSEANIPGHLQVWRDETLPDFKAPSRQEIRRQVYFHLKVKALKEGMLKAQMSLSAYLGTCKALYQLHPEVAPSRWWTLMCRVLKVN